MPRVLTARFMHETNTFSRVATDMTMFRRRDFHLENEIPVAFRGTRSAFGATFGAADKFGWTLVHPVSANPNPSGTVTDDAFETVTGMILDAVDAKGPIDGALLHLPLADRWTEQVLAPWQRQAAPAMDRIVKAETVAMQATIASLIAECDDPGKPFAEVTRAARSDRPVHA